MTDETPGPARAETDPGEQPLLLPGLVRARAGAARQARERSAGADEKPLAAAEPVARVLVDVGPAHLDRTFDYAVPEAMDADCAPGVRVKVRFAGQDVDGYVLERVATSDHPGRLAPLRRVVSAEPVLAPEVVALAGSLAERYAGTRGDVLRLAVPPRHAATEKRESPVAPALDDETRSELATQAASGWSAYRFAEGYVAALRRGETPRAAWTAAPGEDWPRRLAELAAATYTAGRGVLLCLPDGKDVQRVSGALADVLGKDHTAVLVADAGPAARYRDFLAVRRGARRIVVGTRAAAFAPVHDLGLVVVWDDGDDLHTEPRGPYPHTREVLFTRSVEQGAGVLVGGFARTAETELLLQAGWLVPLTPTRETVRERVRVEVAGASEHDLVRDGFARSARIPRQAYDAIRAGLDGDGGGPVLVQTPRRGYAAALACERCRTPTRCRACSGPLRLSDATRPPACAWCGEQARQWACPECGHQGLRAPVLGDARTAEELGRSFPGVRVVQSSAGQVVEEVADDPAIVVATPGAEPVATAGYAAVVLLDAWLALSRIDLRAEEEALRRWLNAAGLARHGGHVVVVGESEHPQVQALVRWDPAGAAARQLAERRSAHLTPAGRLVAVSGAEPDVTAVVDAVRRDADGPAHLEVLGPVEDPEAPTEEVRAVLRVPRGEATALSRSLVRVKRVRSARKEAAVRVQVDPPGL